MPELLVSNPYINCDREAWTSWLKKRNSCGGSQPERVAEIIVAIQHGIEFVRQKLSSNFPEFDMPKLGIIVFKDGEQSAVQFNGYYDDLNTVGATAEWLQQLGALEFDTVYHERPDNEDVILLSATPKDTAKLFGVEECHHGLLVQKEGTGQKQPRVLPVAQYDALPHEFEALQFKVLHADELGLPSITVDCLTRRLKAAKKYRDATM
ncbi:MAG: hypothetical protein KBC47_01835 [Candidatus Peribacteraceae bacterium]|nr:hypothetical protein [Candidatus Peribacteraceae bacterium]